MTNSGATSDSLRLMASHNVPIARLQTSGCPHKRLSTFLDLWFQKASKRSPLLAKSNSPSRAVSKNRYRWRGTDRSLNCTGFNGDVTVPEAVMDERTVSSSSSPTGIRSMRLLSRYECPEPRIVFKVKGAARE